MQTPLAEQLLIKTAHIFMPELAPLIPRLIKAAGTMQRLLADPEVKDALEAVIEAGKLLEKYKVKIDNASPEPTPSP